MTTLAQAHFAVAPGTPMVGVARIAVYKDRSYRHWDHEPPACVIVTAFVDDDTYHRAMKLAELHGVPLVVH